MGDDQLPQDMGALKKWLHDANNRLAVILSTAELLQLESLSPRAMERRKTIEDKTLEVREILRSISEQYLS